MEYTFAGLPLPLRIKPPYPLTDDEIMRFSEEHEPYSVERDPEGYLLVMTPSGMATGRKNNYLSAMLYNWAEEDGRGISFDSNTGCSLPDGSMRAPDAAWLSLDRWNFLDREQQERYAPICPDFIVELRSPSDSLPELLAKMEMWMRNGAVLAWLIDPVEQAVTIYRANIEPECLENLSQVAVEGPIAGFVYHWIASLLKKQSSTNKSSRVNCWNGIYGHRPDASDSHSPSIPYDRRGDYAVLGQERRSSDRAGRRGIPSHHEPFRQ